MLVLRRLRWLLPCVLLAGAALASMLMRGEPGIPPRRVDDGMQFIPRPEWLKSRYETITSPNQWEGKVEPQIGDEIWEWSTPLPPAPTWIEHGECLVRHGSVIDGFVCYDPRDRLESTQPSSTSRKEGQKPFFKLASDF